MHLIHLKCRELLTWLQQYHMHLGLNVIYINKWCISENAAIQFSYLHCISLYLSSHYYNAYDLPPLFNYDFERVLPWDRHQCRHGKLWSWTVSRPSSCIFALESHLSTLQLGPSCLFLQGRYLTTIQLGPSCFFSTRLGLSGTFSPAEGNIFSP